MTDATKNNPDFLPDRFPGLLENPAGYRKGSDDYAVTFAVPINYVEYLQPLMQRAGKVFVVTLLPVTSPEQADALLRSERPAEIVGADRDPPEVEVRPISLGALAALLGDCSEKTVQNYEALGIVARNSRGLYDRDKTISGLYRAWKEAENGKNAAYNDERTAAMRLKRLERERLHEEAMNRLVAFDDLIAAREKKNADIKQKLLFLEKTLPPRLNMLPANEQEAIIKNEIRKLLTEFATVETGGRDHRAGGQDIPAASGSNRLAVGGREKKARK